MSATPASPSRSSVRDRCPPPVAVAGLGGDGAAVGGAGAGCVHLRGDPRLFLFGVALAALPILVTLLQLALSRSREFEADLAAARLTGDPEGLARALDVLDGTTDRMWERLLVARGPLPDPLLLRTHPATGQRTRRLRELEPGHAGWYVGSGPVLTCGYPGVAGPPRLRWPGIRW